MAVYSRKYTRIAMLSVLILLLGAFCCTNGLPATQRRLLQESTQFLNQTPNSGTACEKYLAFKITDTDREVDEQIYTGHRRIDTHMLFELEYTEILRNKQNIRRYETVLIRKENATCVKNINSSHPSCKRSGDYTSDRLHELMNGKGFMAIWHFPLPYNTCMLLIIKKKAVPFNIYEQLYYLRNGQQKSVLLQRAGSKILIPLNGEHPGTEIVSLVFYSPSGAPPNFSLKIQRNDRITQGCSCSDRG